MLRICVLWRNWLAVERFGHAALYSFYALRAGEQVSKSERSKLVEAQVQVGLEDGGSRSATDEHSSAVEKTVFSSVGLEDSGSRSATDEHSSAVEKTVFSSVVEHESEDVFFTPRSKISNFEKIHAVGSQELVDDDAGDKPNDGPQGQEEASSGPINNEDLGNFIFEDNYFEDSWGVHSSELLGAFWRPTGTDTPASTRTTCSGAADIAALELRALAALHVIQFTCM
ncbi:unnamed protein product [Gongylonema pulchrum]|uniref:SIT4 phosphatase-associated family protein n=1 Tax=Gongylonema pulchrum TaxID=637853 RepID=A0A183DUC2_9BILA|nr:unnamed protein product [Gongylonema pulchrum]